MLDSTSLRACSLGFLTACLNFGTASPQDQLSSAFGDFAGGDAVQSFVIISGTTGFSFNDVALATIESSKASVIECVHIAGVISLPPEEAVGATGTLVIQGGGTLATSLVDLGSGEAGSGTLVVRGPGSRVLETPVGDPFCAQARTHNVTVVGSRGAGALVLADGAQLDSLFVPIGNEAGSSGSVRVESTSQCNPMLEPRDADCSQLNIVGVATDGNPLDIGFAAFGNVGRFGAGQLVVDRGRVFISLNGDTVVDPAKAGHGINVGRSPGAVGSVSLVDQSKFLIESSGAGNDLALTYVGRAGTGSLEIAEASLFESQGTNGLFLIGRDPGSVGMVTLKDAGSTLTVEGLVGLSRDFFGNDGGISLLTLDEGTVLNAGEIDARPNSTIFSSGTITLTNGLFTMGGVFNPGNSPGTALINGKLILTSTGLLRLEISGPGGTGGTDKLVVNGDFTCGDCVVQVVLSDGATIDDVDEVDFMEISGNSTGSADIEVVDEDGVTVAAFEDVDLGTGKISVKQVQIDIKPDSAENTINLGSNGVLPVVVFGSPTFDATAIDPATVRLSSAEIRLRGNGTFLTGVRDVDGDGLPDLEIKMSTDALELSSASEMALLTGQTTSGIPFQGSDFVLIVPDGG